MSAKPHEDPNCKCAACEAWSNEERLIAASNLAAANGSEDIGTIGATLVRTGKGRYTLYWDGT